MTKLPADIAAKRDSLLELLQSFGSCAVAFSGGLDSTVLAKAATLALGRKAVAFTATSPSMAKHELAAAKQLAQLIGIRHEVVETDELDLPEYQKNEADRCYHCKKQIVTRIGERAARFNLAVVVDGANRDDLGDHRPGMQAAREKNVRGPLAECGFTKAELRVLAKHWELPIWDKPATPCLSSRIAYGEQITAERLAMIGRAEDFLRERGFQPLRVRYHHGDIARVEVSEESLPRLLEPTLRRELVETFKSLGFKYVSLDLEGFRSGSLNEALPAESLQTHEGDLE
jgi:uncharacterized protein